MQGRCCQVKANIGEMQFQLLRLMAVQILGEMQFQLLRLMAVQILGETVTALSDTHYMHSSYGAVPFPEVLQCLYMPQTCSDLHY